jgi:hypothetical protein
MVARHELAEGTRGERQMCTLANSVQYSTALRDWSQEQ